ncbi:thioredoxin domain-containing protein (plasmid) [Arsenophonus nasoniae]|uniref:Thioredoxin n=1 Tax=Arsenophonus nasoniae TaxID=638 RepID=A0A4P7L215_9GAMM|nr:thioredoxin domain-containing protein [Arsenophonus nasoniae]QBY46581.1 Thioredoxin [Arsenophonus nasoniae]WGM08406.1 thioredoxin domain-containing protein [Arsenophonus nasoniae]WGM13269.1 thioredoxin domain-containing protein [Arsenophonus nasoniae]WGM17814.1 thioredoxin domain-containing protein [Arsenophonus nasoniae]
MDSKKNNTLSTKLPIALYLLVVSVIGVVGFGIWKLYQANTKTNALLTSLVKQQEVSNKELAKLRSSFNKIIELSENSNVPSHPQQKRQPARDSSLNIETVKINKDVLTYGSKDARFSLVTYMDFQCTYCQRLAATPRSLVDSANEGLVNWKWKNSPLPMHEPMATEQAKKYICAGKQDEKNYWDIIASWGSKNLDLTDAAITAKYKLDLAKYEACLKDASGEIKNIIENDKAESQALGISATPTTIIIDNKTGKMKPIIGALPMEQFINTIEEMAKE